MNGPSSNLTKEQALSLYDSKFWETMSHRERAVFQMNEGRLCMPFEIFHEAMEKAIGRSIFSHEFGLNYDGLLDELMNGVTIPSFEEIVNLIPEEKRVLVVV